jgi:two-component system sensor histidine kinase EvgS
MRALVLGRDIRVSVFKTREAPEQIHIDTLVFERVIDNLFTNAAKYTERGSIVVELDGIPGFLTLKVSDTGCGIEEADIAHIFRPEGSAPERRSSHSLGIGLSVVIRLLQQIGGRLEVMSKPAQGTTFWAHFPIQGSESAHAPRSVPLPGDDEVVHQVVTIRRAS